MPSKSKSQQRLVAAAEHDATFPMAQQIQQSMSLGQMRDFARDSMAGKPEHVTKAAPKAKASGHPHANLGRFLHPRKGSK